MGSKVRCYRCREILDSERTIFDGHFYCDDKCAVPVDDDAPFLNAFYRAIEGGTGRAMWW